jgi:probable blue pigment (indigoidine) exporter
MTASHPSRPTGPGGLSLVGVTALAPAAWGTTYLVTTELLPPGRPLLAAALRALPAGLALHVLTRHRPTGTWWAKAMVLGTLNIGAFFALLFVAAHRLPGGVAATLGAIQPLVAAALAAAVLGERLRATTVVAGVLGLAGVTLLVLRADAGLDGVGILAGLAGATSMATGVTLTKRWGRPVPLLAFTSWQLLAGGIVLVPLAVLVEGAPPPPTAASALGHLWLATAGTAVAYALWFRGIEHLPVARASVLGLLSPLVATLAGWAVLHQRLTPAQLAGAALVLGAVVVGQRTTSAGEDLVLARVGDGHDLVDLGGGRSQLRERVPEVAHERLEPLLVETIRPRPLVRGAEVATLVVLRPAEGHGQEGRLVALDPSDVDAVEEPADPRIRQHLVVEAVERRVDRRTTPEVLVQRHAPTSSSG